MSNTSKKGIDRKLRIIGTVAMIALIVIVGLGKRNGNSSTDDETPLTFAARRGPLVISISESGTIQAQEKIVIKNEIQGHTAIIWIVDEGAQVKTGDLLVELDASELEEQLFAQQIKVQNADALFVRAREDLAITENQAASDVEKAETTLRFALQDLEKYIKGEYPQQLREAEVRITLAEEDLQRAEEKQKWSHILFEEKLVSQSELQADELAAKKADLDLELARSTKQLLEDFTNKRDLAELESNAKQAEMALERVRRKATANVVQAEADFAAKEAEFKRQQDKLTELKEQIAATRIVAPSDGLVVYATSAAAASSRHSTNTEPLAPGREVREREALIHLPDTSKMMASIKVHETHVKRLTNGMPARITVDALPNAHFEGTVHQVAPLPDATSFWMNPDLKVYGTEVYIEDGASGLRNGMTCEVELVAESHEDALYVPVQSVVRINHAPSVFVVGKRGSVEMRQVETGGDNNRMIHILAGLTEGEEVLLAPPLRDSEKDKAQRDEEASAQAPVPGKNREAKRKQQ